MAKRHFTFSMNYRPERFKYRAKNTLFNMTYVLELGAETVYHISKVSCHERIVVIGFACFHESTFNPFSSISSGFPRCVSYLLSKSEYEGGANTISRMIKKPSLLSKWGILVSIFQQ